VAGACGGRRLFPIWDKGCWSTGVLECWSARRSSECQKNCQEEKCKVEHQTRQLGGCMARVVWKGCDAEPLSMRSSHSEQ